MPERVTTPLGIRAPTSLATVRLLGGTAGHAIRMVTLEMLPTVIAALSAERRSWRSQWPACPAA
jgi:hypothetical protein